MFGIGDAIEGVSEEYDKEFTEVAGPEDFEALLEDAVGAASPRRMLSTLARARPTGRAPARVARAVSSLSKLAKQVQVQSGRIEAEYLRRPNNLCTIYTASLAPAATVAFSIQPGAGMSFYRLLGMICSDEQANIFAFTSLRVGGVEHVNQTQTTPAAPVTNACSWNLFQLKEGRMIANLAPWSGQLFDNNTPVTGTVANMTVAATGDAFTGAARISLLTQVDPCGMRYQQTQQANARYWGSLKQNLGIYQPLLVER